jgi:DNA-binding MarR family transcriptional regulator
MKFNNLRRRILSHLGHRWRETSTTRLIDLETIQSEFADIPKPDFEASIRSLEDEGHIQISHDGRTISLTRKGLDHLRIIYTENKNEEIIVAEKLA